VWSADVSASGWQGFRKLDWVTVICIFVSGRDVYKKVSLLTGVVLGVEEELDSISDGGGDVGRSKSELSIRTN
jgi:hypothetical protein